MTNSSIGLCHEDIEWEIESYFCRHNFWLKVSESWLLPIVGSIVYLIFVCFGPRYMEKIPRLDLRRPMLVWSIFLAIFSCLGALRFTTALLRDIHTLGSVGKVVCYSNEAFNYPIFRFWSLLFMYSKFVEYVDTVFIVLRKQNLSFLHWYHHFTVAIYTWHSFKYQLAGATMFCGMNYAVHALMYVYYSLRAAKIKVPKPAALLITSLQIVQMLCGCFVVGALVKWGNTTTCRTTSLQLTFAIFMYGTYLILFLNFFYQNYVQPKKNVKTKVPKSNILTENGAIETKHISTTNKHDLRHRKVAA